MGVENILILVFIWHQRMPGHNSAEVYRNVLERAKDLLTTLHVRVLEAEAMLQQRLEQNNSGAALAITYQGEESRLGQGRGGPDGRRNQGSVYALRDRINFQKQQQQSKGNDLVTKVYPSDVIPDQYVERKRDYRPNNFLSGEVASGGSSMLRANTRGQNSVLGRRDQNPAARSALEQYPQEEEELEIELTEEEFQYAVEMTEVSIRRLTKAHIIDLRNIVKPHHLVEKVLNMVCILRGCIAPNWTMAREMMSSMTFKLELVLLDAAKIKQSLVKRVIKILNNFHKHLTPDNLARINEGSSILLTWIINLVKWNAGVVKYKFQHNPVPQQQDEAQEQMQPEQRVMSGEQAASDGMDPRGYGWARKSSHDHVERSDDEGNEENYKFTGGTKSGEALQFQDRFG